jgi:hypothetical protein
VLVLPFNFEADSAEYMRLSMPTKAPAYMASGAPILVYGPSHIAPVRYAIREGWGHVVSTPGADAVAKAIADLADNQYLRESVAKRAQAIAALRHNAVRVRAEFQDLLRG